MGTRLHSGRVVKAGRPQEGAFDYGEMAAKSRPDWPGIGLLS